MNFPRIFDIFSRRHRESERVNKPLTTEFRNRVIMLCVDKFSDPVMPTPVIRRSQFWSEMHTNLRYLHGRPDLAGRNRESADKEVITFLASCSDEHFLDFVEYASKSQALKISTINSAEFIRSVNEFFDLDALPYYLTGFRISAGESVHPSTIGFPTSDPHAGIRVSTVSAYPQVICKEDEILHQQAVSPTLSLLAEPHFTSANEEFLEALKHYRKGEYRDCVLKCGNSFESVMKIICDRKNWPYQQADAASRLLKTILPQTTLDTFYEQPIILIATIRNRYSTAHGAGTQQKIVPKHVANYVINATASAILLLVDETNP